MNMEKSEDTAKGNNSDGTMEKIALAHDGGNSSDDEGEVIPKVVDNFYFTDENQEPISFTVLPIDWGGDENNDRPKEQVFLEGSADGGLQKVYKQVVAWKLNLDEQRPVISVKIKERAWIQLQKPRKSYEEIIGSVLIAAHFLHFARRNSEASEKAHWDHLRKVFSMADVTPADSDLLKYFSLIEGMHQRDQKLRKSDVLKNFLEMKSKKRKPSDEDVENITKAKRSKFLVTDEESDEDLGEDGLDDSEEEEDDLFDSVCAICDNGGELLCCEGACMRSFHPNRESGEDSNCKSLGLTKAQVRDIQNFYCRNCKYKQHQCFICGKLGSSDKSTGAEVFSCISATCGRFYHPQCVSKVIAPEDEAEDLEKKIANGLQFTCPVHKCLICKQTENKEDENLQFAICRRCPRAYHRKCLPKSIQFDDTDDEPQRAWDDLIPNRILIYCRKHKIDPDLQTPKRNHIVFPEVPSSDKPVRRNHVISPEPREAKAIGKRVKEFAEPSKEKFLPKPSVKKEKSTLSARETPPLKVRGSYDLPKKLIREKEISSSVKREDKLSALELRKNLSLKESKTKVLDPGRSKTVKAFSSSMLEVKRKPTVLPSFTENDVKSSVMAIIERATASINLNDICAMHQAPSTYRNSSSRLLDKTITQGKVEGSVEAVRSALKKLEGGGSIDDAKAVCEPDVLLQMSRWKSKLRVYLAPFIHGMRYTSFGRHFTKVDKLREIVERLHWYVQNGDTIVDFCCGANDFSRLMKEKLDQVGRKCFFRNFDIIQPENDFEFEKRDWLSVCKDELPIGSRLIMGLNPPFGVKAALANKFVNKALEFKPKLVILIVPKETHRLDEKSGATKYDLVWEDPDLLRGQSFYLPGSTDTDDNQVSQWNNVAPPLYLWSRSDWTGMHKSIASKQGHTNKETPEKNMVTAQSEVLDTKPPNDREGNAFLTVEGKANLEKHSEKDQQDSGFGTKTVNLSGVDYKENEKESQLVSLYSVQRVDESQRKDGSSLKIKDENKESSNNRHVADKMNREDNSFSYRNYEAQKEKESDCHDHANGRPTKHLEQNHVRRQDKGGHDDESGRKKNQKEMSPSRERIDRVDKDKYEKGRYEKGRHETDRRDKDRSKRERPDKDRFEKERAATSPPPKRMENRKDEDSDHFQEHGSLPLNSPENFGRVYDRGPGNGNREDLARGLQIGSTDLGQEFVRGNVDEGYGMGYRRISGGGEDGPGRGVHRGISEEYGRGLQLGRSGNVEEEYAAGEINRGIHRNFPGSLESEYSVSPADLQVLQSSSRVYSRQGQHDFDSERPRFSQDSRGSEWLMGDTSQRGRYYIDQGSHVNNIYTRNSDLVPDMPRSVMLGQQHEDHPQLHSRLPYQSDAYEPYERTSLTSSAMQRYAPRLDHQMNYTRSSLHQIEPPPRNSIYGTGQVLGSQNFPFDSRSFAPGSQNPYPHQSSSGWIDD